MEFLYEYGLFFAKIITFAIAIVLTVAGIIAISSSDPKIKKGKVSTTDLSKQFAEIKDDMNAEMLTKDELKLAAKKKKKQKTEPSKSSTLFVVEFTGSTDAKEVKGLREEINAILSVATPDDEVLVKVESGGGVVHGYGLCASQLVRLKNKKINLTIAIDKVAASGGYMMACVADKILAAPFAIVGSIGVVAAVPNFSKLLKKNDIDYEQFTAGQFKRTVTMFGENSEDGIKKFKSELEETHVLFKDFVSQHRPSLDIDKIATGEHWFGTTALKLDLIDEISTSDDYIMSALEDKRIIEVRFTKKKDLSEKLSLAASMSFERILGKVWENNKVKFQ